MNVDVLILGGGLAGLSTAYHLGERGVRSRLVVEAKDRVGGTAGSVTTGKFTFDYTGHLLHLHDSYGQALILDLLKGNVAAHERKHLAGWSHPVNAPRPLAIDCGDGRIYPGWKYD